MHLGINIDHIATLRQARREMDPDPILAAQICLASGADSIVAHLREDRRHIQDIDIIQLRKLLKNTKFNLEMSVVPSIVNIACKIKPDVATLVPERREEVTTEGGLDVIKNFKAITNAVQRLQKKHIEVSLFIDPSIEQIKKAKASGAQTIEIHTGTYARAKTSTTISTEIKKIKESAMFAKNLGLKVAAGHGLNYTNVQKIVAIKEIEELNIGHSIISQAVFIGLPTAVKKMSKLMTRAS